MRVGIAIVLLTLGASIAHAQDAGLPPPSCVPVDRRSADADRCAEALFRAADADASAADLSVDVTPWGFYPGPARLPDSAITQLIGRVQAASAHAQRLAQSYQRVIEWTRASWTIQALIGQACVYERLAAAIRGASLVSGNDAFDVQIAPIECLAVARYVLAVRGARAGGIRLPAVTTAIAQLGRYSTDRLSRCVADQQRRDSSFAPFSPLDLEPF